MKFTQLKYFLKIAEVGSVSAAARELFIAQPALSHQVAALENELGVLLFVRSVKGVRLTLAGEKLVHHAKLILRQVDIAKADVISDEFSPRGEVSVVIDASKAYTLIPLLVTECASRFPEVQLKIYDAMSLNAAQNIADGKVDIGLIPNAADLSGVHVIPVYREPLHLVGKGIAAKHLSGTILFEELSNYPLVAPSRPHNIRLHIEQKALEAKWPLDIQYEQDTGLTLRCLMNNGIANAIIPYDVMTTELQRGDLDALKIINPSIDRIHAIVRLENRSFSSACRAIELLLIELIQQLCEQNILDGEALV
ncbi:LysR family transcriptional regulator [Neptunomonas antarctica]|uniref:Transcriptional regulator, LysR family n=1 Tax=Neptunomonas antarctica TaxID=619304 RepID=A0A1N7KIG4_9GAMM|nr:LysR family transcriptional regulator [Neptunomonas antarctica]SIS61398.1 transcriptional regulator, LysR family [Neptunomonas antarctica]